MAMKKVDRLSHEIDKLGVRMEVITSKSECLSNNVRYEFIVCCLKPHEPMDTIVKETREAICNMAGRVGFYTKFFAKDHFEGHVNRETWNNVVMENGITAVFLSKYPFTQAKKIMRALRQESYHSFAYIQEDVGAIQKVLQTKEVEKEVLSLTRTDPEFAVYDGAVLKSPPALLSRSISNFVFLYRVTLEQERDLLKTVSLLQRVF